MTAPVNSATSDISTFVPRNVGGTEQPAPQTAGDEFAAAGQPSAQTVAAPAPGTQQPTDLIPGGERLLIGDPGDAVSISVRVPATPAPAGAPTRTSTPVPGSIEEAAKAVSALVGQLSSLSAGAPSAHGPVDRSIALHLLS